MTSLQRSNLILSNIINEIASTDEKPIEAMRENK